MFVVVYLAVYSLFSYLETYDLLRFRFSHAFINNAQKRYHFARCFSLMRNFVFLLSRAFRFKVFLVSGEEYFGLYKSLTNFRIGQLNVLTWHIMWECPFHTIPKGIGMHILLDKTNVLILRKAHIALR